MAATQVHCRGLQKGAGWQKMEPPSDRPARVARANGELCRRDVSTQVAMQQDPGANRKRRYGILSALASDVLPSSATADDLLDEHPRSRHQAVLSLLCRPDQREKRSAGEPAGREDLSNETDRFKSCFPSQVGIGGSLGKKGRSNPVSPVGGSPKPAAPGCEEQREVLNHLTAADKGRVNIDPRHASGQLPAAGRSR